MLSRYYIWMAVGAAANSARGAVYAIVLNTEGFGQYSIVSNLALYLFYACELGLLEGLTLKLPSLYVSARHGEGRQWARRVVRHVMIIGFALLVCGAGWAVFAGDAGRFLLAALSA